MPTAQSTPRRTSDLRELFRQPERIGAFSQLFEDAVPTWPPDFHQELYAGLTGGGNFAGAAPRGFAKSTITDLVFIAHQALNGYANFIILISDTYTQSVMLLEALKTELQNNPHIKELYGDVVGGLWSNDSIIIRGLDKHGEPTTCKVIARGAGMKIRGLRYLHHRPQLIVCDDLENDEQVQSSERREKLRNWFTKAVLPALDRDHGRIVVIGTILHRESLLAHIIDGRDEFAGWRRVKMKALDDDGNSIWPDVVPTERLVAMRDDPIRCREWGIQYLGAIAFSQEMMNEPMEEGSRIIPAEYLVNSDERPNVRFSLVNTLQAYARANKKPFNDETMGDWLKQHFSRILADVDPAISEKKKADYWAMVTIGITKACPFCEGAPAGHIVLLDIERMRTSDIDRQVTNVLESFQDWRQDRIKVEAVAYQAGLYALIRKKGAELGIYPTVVPWQPDKDKTRRAVLFSPNFTGGLVHIRSDHPLSSVFVDEVVQFPQGEHDDTFDAFMAAAEETVKRIRGRTHRKKPAGW